MPTEFQDGILLTGATGTVGRTLAGMLSAASIPFKAFVRDPVRAREILGAHAQAAKLVRGDLADRYHWRQRWTAHRRCFY